MANKRYFHISSLDLGSSVILIAKVPPSAGAKECKITKRVCFAPSIRQAVIGVISCGEKTNIKYVAYNFCHRPLEKVDNYNDYSPDLILPQNSNNFITNPTIYVTEDKLSTPEKEGSDFHITGEMWSLTDIYICRKIGISKSERIT